MPVRWFRARRAILPAADAALPSRKSEDGGARHPPPEELPDVRETSEPASSVVPAAPGEPAEI